MPNPQRMCRNLKSVNEEDLLIDACLLPWENILMLADSDLIVSALVENLKCLMDKHASLRPVRERLKGNAPWFTREIAIAIVERDIAKRYWRITRTNEDHKSYLKPKVFIIIVYFKIARTQDQYGAS
jgi:hypothetical protein